MNYYQSFPPLYDILPLDLASLPPISFFEGISCRFFSSLWNTITDVVTAPVNLAIDIVTDPVGTFSDPLGTLADIVTKPLEIGMDLLNVGGGQIQTGSGSPGNIFI